MKIAKEVEQILETIEASGEEAYVVGGSVRDALLGREPYDWDIATSASAETVTGLFPRTAQIGAKFGIVKVLTGDLAVDVAAYRIDGPYTDSRRPDEVFFTKHLYEDLQRRDFTMNAMAYCPKHGLIDPFGGQADIAGRIVRTVGDPKRRFQEDALRILRGIRLAVQLDFVIEIETKAEMEKNARLLQKISIERIRDEFERILLSPHAAKGLRLCSEMNILTHILGDWILTIDEREQRAFDILLTGIDDCPVNLATRLSLLLLCFDKKQAESSILKLKHSRPMEHKLLNAVHLTEQLSNIRSKPSLKDFISKHGYKNYIFIEDLIRHLVKIGMDTIIFEKTGKEEAAKKRQGWIDEINSGREAVLPEDLAVNGRDLLDAGTIRGREVGMILEQLLLLVHQQPDYNEKTVLLKEAEKYIKR